MLPTNLMEHLELFFGKKITQIKSQSGGSINLAYQIEIGKQSYFLKTNDNVNAFQMFESEIFGLQLLGKANTLKTPNIIKIGKEGTTSFLILDYIEEGISTDFFWEKFGRQLAQLHRTTSDFFGLEKSNFIGTLPQSNKFHSSWIEFYIQERLIPQINLAEKNQLLPSFLKKQFDDLFKILNEFFPIENSSLIHGDLWSGNFLMGKNETPILIDPSVSYSHREMDLAMSMLFGGFDQRFYLSYNEEFPLQPNFEKRVQLYQLYPLLVHVNLFGKSYLGSVQKILNRYLK